HREQHACPTRRSSDLPRHSLPAARGHQPAVFPDPPPFREHRSSLRPAQGRPLPSPHVTESELVFLAAAGTAVLIGTVVQSSVGLDRKSTRLNSSHVKI